MDTTNNLNRKVWIVNFAGHDFSNAKEYGELENLTVGRVNLISLDRAKFDLTQKIFEQTNVEDYLLLSGKPVLVAIAVSAWLYKHGKCRMLIHELKKNKEHVYRLLDLSSENFNDILNAITTIGV